MRFWYCSACGLIEETSDLVQAPVFHEHAGVTTKLAPATSQSSPRPPANVPAAVPSFDCGRPKPPAIEAERLLAEYETDETKH